MAVNKRITVKAEEEVLHNRDDEDGAVWKDMPGRDGSENDPYWIDPETKEKKYRKKGGQGRILHWKEDKPDPHDPEPSKLKDGKYYWNDLNLPNVQMNLRWVTVGPQLRLGSLAMAKSYMLRRYHVLQLIKDPNYIVSYLLRFPSDGLYLFALTGRQASFKGSRKLPFLPMMNLFSSFSGTVHTRTFNHLYPLYTEQAYRHFYLFSTLYQGKDISNIIPEGLRTPIIMKEAQSYNIPGAYGKFSKSQLLKMIDARVDGLQCELYLLNLLDQEEDLKLLCKLVESYKTPELFNFVLMFNIGQHGTVKQELLDIGLKTVPGAVQEIVHMNKDILDVGTKDLDGDRWRTLDLEGSKKLLETFKTNISDEQIEEYIKENPYDYRNIETLFGKKSEELKDRCKKYYVKAIQESKIYNIDPNQYFLVKLMEEEKLSEISVKTLKSRHGKDFNLQAPFFIKLFQKYPNLIRYEDIDYKSKEVNNEKDSFEEIPSGMIKVKSISELLKASVVRIFPFKTRQQCIFFELENEVYALENKRNLIDPSLVIKKVKFGMTPGAMVEQMWVLQPKYNKQQSNDRVEAYHELQKGKRMVAWIRFTQLNDNTIWIDEVQSDLYKILLPEPAKELEGLLEKFIYNFVHDMKSKRGIKNFYYPDATLKWRLYQSNCMRSLYEDLPKKCKFKKTVVEGVHSIVNGFPCYYLKV